MYLSYKEKLILLDLRLAEASVGVAEVAVV
jgi:hypothetical protein